MVNQAKVLAGVPVHLAPGRANYTTVLLSRRLSRRPARFNCSQTVATVHLVRHRLSRRRPGVPARFSETVYYLCDETHRTHVTHTRSVYAHPTVGVSWVRVTLSLLKRALVGQLSVTYTMLTYL